MKTFIMTVSLALAGFAFAAFEENPPFPSDFAEKVAARETARTAAMATATVTIAQALDLRTATYGTLTPQSAFDAVFLRLYPTDGIPYDPAATVGFMLFLW